MWIPIWIWISHYFGGKGGDDDDDETENVLLMMLRVPKLLDIVNLLCGIIIRMVWMWIVDIGCSSRALHFVIYAFFAALDSILLRFWPISGVVTVCIGICSMLSVVQTRLCWWRSGSRVADFIVLCKTHGMLIHLTRTAWMAKSVPNTGMCFVWFFFSFRWNIELVFVVASHRIACATNCTVYTSSSSIRLAHASCHDVLCFYRFWICRASTNTSTTCPSSYAFSPATRQVVRPDFRLVAEKGKIAQRAGPSHVTGQRKIAKLVWPTGIAHGRKRKPSEWMTHPGNANASTEWKRWTWKNDKNDKCITADWRTRLLA